MLGKKLINSGPTGSSGASTFASENFNTVLYTGDGGSQKIGGYINRAAQFNGSNSVIDIEKMLDVIDNNFAFSFWHKTPSTFPSSGYPTLFSMYGYLGYGSAYGWSFEYNNNNQFMFYWVSSSGVGNYIYSNTLTANTWYHIVFQKNSSSASIYVNGTLQTGGGSTSSYAMYYNGFARLTIGAKRLNFGSTSSHVSGLVDQVRLFNKQLSTSEITTLGQETSTSNTKSTTDIFDDNSAIALYQLDGNANDTGGVTGKYEGAAIFNGTSSTIDLPAGSFRFPTLSISAWIKQPSQDASDIILENYDYQSSTSRGFIFRTTSGKLKFDGYYSDGAVTTAQSNESISLDTWTHVACVLNQSASGVDRIKLFINGSEATYSSRAFNDIQYHTTCLTTIGALSYTGGADEQYFTGSIDELRIYDDALTATEIGYIYNNTTASIPTGNLSAYYKFNGNAIDEQQLYDGAASNVIYAHNGTPSNVTYQDATSFSPDLVVIKQRNGTQVPIWYDSVRGVHKYIYSTSTAAEGESSATLTSFDSNGFSVGSSNSENQSGYNFVAWCFNAGSGSAANNTDGNGNTSTVKANQAAGFSIVKYTSASYQADGTATIGHGLGADVRLVIQKRLNSVQGWYVMTDIITGSPQYLQLSETSAAANITAPTNFQLTDSVFSNWESIGNTMIQYCFADVAGYQKIDKYTGNGSVNGPIVETGFEPAFLMVKRTDTSGFRWVIWDNKRDTSNTRTTGLSPNLTNAEITGFDVDFLSNGFQLRDAETTLNASGGTYLYLAIAADPDATTPTVADSFDVVTYTGTGAAQDIEVDFKPDLVWIKNRANGVTNSWHTLSDSVRDGRMWPNDTAAQDTFKDVKSFNDNGFTVDNGTYSNYNGGTYVAWCWKAGDHDNNLPQINTEGTIDSTVSVNDAAGFSIVKFNGASGANTVGHGLSQAPELFIMKSANVGGTWGVYVKDLGANKYLTLNSDTAATTSTGVWNNTHPTSTLLHWQGGLIAAGGSGSQYTNIAYCWYSVSGYSKIATFAGTNYTNAISGLGFAPRFVMIKNTTGTGPWVIHSKPPTTTNPSVNHLRANTSGSEDSGAGEQINFDSDGFTINYNACSNINCANNTFLYMAFK